MSDMATNETTATQNDSIPSAPDAPEKVTQDNDTFNKDEVQQAVERARQQEKDKLYQRLADLDASRDDLSKKLQESTDMLKVLVSERDEAKKLLEEKAQSELSAEEKVAQRLKALEEKEIALQEQLERVASEAALRVRESELKVYRANKIAESGLTLTELVTGSTEDDIDASIALAKERENAIFNRAREQARAELSSQLPKPAPTAAETQTNNRLVDASKKFELANLSPEDFNRLKSELLAKARGN
jgi:hypothetical protein